MAATLDSSTMSMWRRRHGHTKENNKGKISTLYRDFSGGKTHDWKEMLYKKGKILCISPRFMG